MVEQTYYKYTDLKNIPPFQMANIMAKTDKKKQVVVNAGNLEHLPVLQRY